MHLVLGKFRFLFVAAGRAQVAFSKPFPKVNRYESDTTRRADQSVQPASDSFRSSWFICELRGKGSEVLLAEICADLWIIASTIGQPGWYTYFNLPQQGEPGYSGRTTRTIATANGLFSGGGAVGALFMMWSAEKFGRKRNIQLGCFLSVLGGALQGGAATLA
jgi:MFS family permease